MKTYFLITCLILPFTLQAQGMKDILSSAKSEAQRRVSAKANQQIDKAVSQGIDKALDKTLYKLFPKPTGDVFSPGNAGTAASKISVKKPASTNGRVNENGEILIATNIKCASGKKAIEQNLLTTPGVSTALVDIDSGVLYLTLSGTITKYDDITDMIRKNGFTADGKKARAV